MRVATVLGLMLAALPAAAQTAADSAAVRKTALDYIDGWWSGDAQRMSGALHPELVKRIRGSDPAGTREWIDQQGASRLVMGTGRGGGRETPAAEQKSEVGDPQRPVGESPQAVGERHSANTTASPVHRTGCCQ